MSWENTLNIVQNYNELLLDMFYRLENERIYVESLIYLKLLLKRIIKDFQLILLFLILNNLYLM